MISYGAPTSTYQVLRTHPKLVRQNTSIWISSTFALLNIDFLLRAEQTEREPAATGEDSSFAEVPQSVCTRLLLFITYLLPQLLM